MVDTKRYSKMEETGNLPSLFDIVSITKCSKSEVSDRQLIVLSDICKTLYRGVKDKIGSPKDYSINLKKNKFTEDTTDISIPEYVLLDVSKPKDNKISNNDEDAQTEAGFDINHSSKLASKSIEEKQDFTPIKALNSFVPDWKLKAKVARKGEKKSWSNARGTGYLMTVDLIDSNGDQIQGTFFKDAVDKFDPMIEEGAVYMFANGCVKMANKKFTAIKNVGIF